MRSATKVRSKRLTAVTALSISLLVGAAQLALAGSKHSTIPGDSAGSCGSWTLVPTPSPSTKSNFLNGVAAVTSSDVWAVGSQQDQFFQSKPLIEHFDGSVWSVVDGARVDGGSYLLGVSAVSASDVWAVGSRVQQGVSHTLIEHWDGAAWSVQDAPNPSLTSNQLLAVSASGPADAWAVGVQFTPDQVNLALHWDGIEWSVSDVPNPTNFTGLQGVVSLASDDAWAVGNASAGPESHGFFAHWDGSSWDVIHDFGEQSGNVGSVAGSSPDDVWAVGSFGKAGNLGPWAEHFNGSRWSPKKVARNPLKGRLNGVAVGSPALAWAVGYAEDEDDNHSQSFSELWDGVQWVQVATVNPGNHRNELLAVTSDAPTTAWAVGAYQDTTGPWLTFAESYC